MSLKILHIDDDERVCQVTGRMLTHCGHIVTTFLTAAEALDHFDAQMYDLVITDNEMPEMTGLTLCHAILERNPHQRILMISGGTIRPAGLPEAVLYMSKPVRLAELRDTLVDIEEMA